MRYYSATAVRTQLTASISGSATVATVASTSGFPASVPFTLLLEPGQLTEEVVSVTSVGGLTLTLARGQDGTSAVPHDVGADIRHGLSARDLREPQEHIEASNGVHGIDGNVVGDTDVQGLTNKTIDGNLNSLSNVPKGALPSDTVYTGTSQTLANKVLNAATINSGTLAGRAIEDTGELEMSASLNYTGNKTYRRVNGWVEVDFGLTLGSGGGSNVDQDFGTLPSGFRPARVKRGTAWVFSPGGPGLTPYRLSVAADGSVVVASLTIAVGGTVNFSIAFPLG